MQFTNHAHILFQPELYKMNPVGTPARKLKSEQSSFPIGAVHNRPLQKDRVYVHFADERGTSLDPNLKYTDETNAYATYSTRGHFTANPQVIDRQTSPLINGEPVSRSRDLPTPTRKSQGPVWPNESSQVYGRLSPERSQELINSQDRNQDIGVPLSARSYELSPSSTRKKMSSPKQTQSLVADRVGQYEEPRVGMSVRDQYGETHSGKVLIRITLNVHCYY